MADKHTMRRSLCAAYCIPMDLEISEVIRYQHTHEDGSQEVAVSSADLLLNDTNSFILQKTISSRFGSTGTYRYGNLNKGGLWETFIEELENTCISKRDRIHRYHEKSEIVYTVPVVGHMLFLPPVGNDDFELGAYHEIRQCSVGEGGNAEKVSRTKMNKIKMNPAQFMFWEGKYYDATKVYNYKPELSNYLKPLGSLAAPLMSVLSPVNTPNGIIEFTKNVTYHNAQHHREHQYCRIIHQGQGAPHQSGYGGSERTGGWTQKGTGDYLEINLGYPRCVTHIGTAGQFPATRNFPTRRIVGRRRMRRFRLDEEKEEYLLSERGNGVRMSKFSPFVQTLKEDEHALCWVTSYEVHFRHTVTNKWTLLTATSANSDAFEEHVLDLSPHFNAKHGLLTQYLRIRPLEHHNKPCMRVSVYGVDPTLCVTTLTDAGRAEMGAGEDFLVAAPSGDEVPTITYAITQSSAKSGPYYVHDSMRNFYSSYNPYRYNRDDPIWRTSKRREFRRIMWHHDRYDGVQEVKADRMHGIDYKNS